MSNMSGKAVTAALVCSAAILGGCGGGGGTSAASSGTPFGHATASGEHAAAQASGRTDPFNKLRIHVDAAPAQRVHGTWSVACRSGMYMVGHDGDTFAGRTPLTVQMRKVEINGVPGSCTAVGSATLAGSGRVTVRLLGDS